MQEQCNHWNSTFVMMKSIERNVNTVSQLLIERNEVDYLVGVNPSVLRDVISFLEPFKLDTDDLEAN